MRITEKLVNSPEEEGVTLEYIRLTKDFEEIKEYVRHKGDTLTGYKQTKEKVSVRNIALFSAVPAAAVPIQNIGRAFCWNYGFLYLICCHVVGSGDGSVLPDRQSDYTEYKLADHYASDCSVILACCDCCNSAQLRKS